MAGKQYAVEVRGVKKSFYLPHHKNDQLKSAITQLFKKKDKTSDEFHALNGISFAIEKGDFFGILGRNGSGKSTLLKIIAEIYQPTAGSVRHEGKMVSFIELGVGFRAELSGRENVYLNGALLGFSKKEVDAMYDDIVAFAELEDFMDQKLKNYSSGMKVRLAFSVAIRAEADVLILDEVLAVGDAAFQKKCNDYFRTLVDDKKTVILVTHNMAAVKDFCNKAILIEGGKIVHQGDADEVADEYVRLFSEQNIKSNNNQKRWGTGEIVFTDIDTIVEEDSVTVKFDVKNESSHDVEGVDIGVDFYDKDKKVVVCGTQYIRRFPKGFAIKANESKQVVFTFKNNFGGRSYWINVNLKTDHGDTVSDYWKEAVYFTNDFEQEHFFPVLLDAEVKIS